MKTPIHGLYAIIDPDLCLGRDPLLIAEACLKGGARILQWRDKEKKYFDSLPKIKELKKKYEFIFIINDDPELAEEIQADGVHLGQEDMEVAIARGLLGPDKIIGKSTHSLAQAATAWQEELDYIALGGIYPTHSKPTGHPVVGISCLKEVCIRSTKPVVAIGGINRRNFKEIVKVGVDSVAMISALCGAFNPEEEAKYYSSLLQKNV